MYFVCVDLIFTIDFVSFKAFFKLMLFMDKENLFFKIKQKVYKSSKNLNLKKLS